MTVFQKIFTWWNGATVGTSFFTFRKGVRVGEDEQGNVYYRTKDGGRRWVIYKGEAEASRVPAEWHRWLHRTTDTPPSESMPAVKPWEKDHKPNLTGTAGAYYPDGSLNRSGVRQRASGDYKAWRP